jgi:tetratricopeptide (TPR) repeat protein
MSTNSTIAGMDKQLFKKLSLYIVAVAFLLYGNSVMNTYSLDDEFVTVTNPEQPETPNHKLVSQGFAGIPKIFASRLVEQQGESFGYRPVVVVSYAVEYQFFGANPHISHIINVLLYALTGIVLFYLLLKLLPKYNYVFPLLVVLVFMAHPLHTEIVNSLKGRDELLFFLFGLVATVLYFKYYDTGKLKYVGWALLFMFLAYLSKRTILAFFGVIPLMIYFFRAVDKKKIFIIVGSMVSIVVLSVLFKKGMVPGVGSNTDSYVENPLFMGSSFADRIPVAIDTYWQYLQLMLFPIYLSFYYGFDYIPIAEWGSVTVWISLVIHLGMVAFAIYKIKEKHILSFAILLYMGVLFGFSNLPFPIVGIIGERFTYIATLGFSIAVVYLIFTLSKLNFKAEIAKVKLPAKVMAVLLVVLGFYTIRVWTRNGDWKDKITLYRNDIVHMDNSARGHFMLANELVYLSQTKPQEYGPETVDETIKHLKRSVEIYPKYIVPLNNLGQLLIAHKGEFAAAKHYLKMALAVDSTHHFANYNLGDAYVRQQNVDSAEYYFSRAIDFGAEFPNVFISLNFIYAAQKDNLKIKELNQKAVQLFPENYQFYIFLGNALFAEQDYQGSLQAFETGSRLGYNLLDVNKKYAVNVRLSEIHNKLGDPEKAQIYAQRANALRPK